MVPSGSPNEESGAPDKKALPLNPLWSCPSNAGDGERWRWCDVRFDAILDFPPQTLRLQKEQRLIDGS